MSKIDEFKMYVKKNPKLINYVKDGSMTWQGFYEIYDLYGEDNNVWSKYLSNTDEEVTETKKSSISSVGDIVKMVKNMDVDKVQEGITSLQKAVDLFSGLFIKDGAKTNTTAYTPRPIYRSFED